MIVMEEVVDWVLSGAITALVGSTIVQIAPIKINPWSWIAKAIGRAINGEVIEKVNFLEKQMQEMKTATEEHAAISCRIRILRFGDELLHDVHHSKEHFDQILVDIKEYDDYCREHPGFKNNMTAITTSKIKEIYANCLEEHSFL